MSLFDENNYGLNKTWADVLGQVATYVHGDTYSKEFREISDVYPIYSQVERFIRRWIHILVQHIRHSDIHEDVCEMVLKGIHKCIGCAVEDAMKSCDESGIPDAQAFFKEAKNIIIKQFENIVERIQVVNDGAYSDKLLIIIKVDAWPIYCIKANILC